jgi:hypothetical protein
MSRLLFVFVIQQLGHTFANHSYNKIFLDGDDDEIIYCDTTFVSYEPGERECGQQCF